MNTTKNLSAGTVTVYDFGKIKLHAYDTKDALCDAAFIVEGENALVGIELPAFTENLDAWKEYIASLKKPMNDIIISDHPAGADYIKEMNVWGTKNAKKSVSGGTAFGITQGLLKAFGPAFRGNFVASIKNILREGKNTIAGIDFPLTPKIFSNILLALTNFCIIYVLTFQGKQYGRKNKHYSNTNTEL